MEKKSDKQNKPKALAMLTIPLAAVSPLAADLPASAAASQLAPQETQDAASQASSPRADITTAIPGGEIDSYKVASGDSLASIAKRFAIPVSRLANLNNLGPGSRIKVGQVLKLTGEVDLSSIAQTYKVRSGDTLSKVAAAHGLSLDELLALNRINSSTIVYPGQVLKVARITPAIEPKTESGENYLVAAGDTLQSIADRFAISVDQLREFNQLERSSIIYVGQELSLRKPSVVQRSSIAITPIVSLQPQSEAVFPYCELHGYHTVKAGETVAKIAAVYGLSTQSLLSENSLSWSRTLYVGQRLRLPGVHSQDECEALTPLSESAFEAASVIVGVGRSLEVSEHGLVIALISAMQESGMRSHLSQGNRFGLFQLSARSGWGSISQLLNAEYSSRAFFEGVKRDSFERKGLLHLAGWEGMAPADAAQAIAKRFDAEKFQRWELSARSWLEELKTAPSNV